VAFWEKFLNSLEKLWLIQILISRRFVALIISLLTLFSLLGMIIPQEATSPANFFQGWQKNYPTLAGISKKLGLVNLFYSWWFLLLLFLVFLSMFFCTLLRLKPVRKRREVLGKRKPRLTLKYKPQINDLRKYFFTRLYFISFEEGGDDELCMRAWRGGARFFSVLFHLGMMVVLLASVVDKSSGLRGKMLFTEGQILTERHFDYLEIYEAALFNENHHFFQIGLEKAEVEYSGTVITDVEAWLRITDGNYQKEKKVLVNYPLIYKGFSFLIENSGFSPLISIVDNQGKLVFSSYISLGQKNKQSFHDFVNFTDYRLKLELFPNTVEPNKQQLVRNPQLELSLLKGGKAVWQGRLNYGETISSPLGQISFNDLRRWVSFQVSYNPSLNFIFLGFLIASLGVTGRLLLLPRSFSLWIRPRGKKWEVYIEVRARWGKTALRKEVAQIEKFLKDRYN
jgi:cytochrome c biogenesis protein ResB